MKRGFIRVLYGDCTLPDSNLRKEIDVIIDNPIQTDYLAYIYGKANYDYLMSRGVNCKLVDERPFVWDKAIGLRHKIESYRIAMEDDGYDQIAFLDWDTVLVKPVPSNLWERMMEKKEIQACLYTLKQFMSPWRGIHKIGSGARTGLNSNFLYMRDKTYPSKIIAIWDTIKDWDYQRNFQDNDEIATMLFIDKMYGKWIGKEEWLKYHEPIFARVTKKCSYTKEEKDISECCFVHRWAWQKI